LYNPIQLLRKYVAQAKQCQTEGISSEKFFEDVRDQLIAWNLVLPVEQTLVLFEECPSAQELRSLLEGILSGVWSERGWKAKPQPNRKRTKHQGKRGHGSVFRILQAHAQKSNAQINQTTT
jgi:hypothetical protein